MAVELSEKNQKNNVSEMKDGDIAVITNWSLSKYVGRIVQRYGNDLITVGKSVNFSWNNIFPDVAATFSPVCRVRILRKGEKLTVV